MSGDSLKPLAVSCRGFSLVELVAVIVLIGIVSVFIIPRFSGKDVFADYATQDLIIAAARIAQQRAMYDHAAGSCYRLAINGNVLGAQRYDGVSYNYIGPAEWQSGITLDNEVSVGDTVVYFDDLGSAIASSGANCTGTQTPTAAAIAITGAANLQVCIYSSGHVQAQVQGDVCS